MSKAKNWISYWVAIGKQLSNPAFIPHSSSHMYISYQMGMSFTDTTFVIPSDGSTFFFLRRLTDAVKFIFRVQLLCYELLEFDRFSDFNYWVFCTISDFTARKS